MSRRSWIVSLVAGAAVLLTFIGGGSAVAYWTAQTQLAGRTTAATVGMVQTVQDSSLAVTYSDSTLAAVGTVTVKNTGSRAATATLTASAVSPTASGLPAAISLAVAPVTAASACTVGASLDSAQFGTLGSAFAASTPIASGQTVVLCVRTSMAKSQLATYSGASTTLRLKASLVYAAGAAWQTSGSQVDIQQKVAVTQYVPAGMLMSCTDNNGWNLDQWFTESEKSDRIHYRYFLAREATPAARVPYSPARGADAWWPDVQVAASYPSLLSFVNASGIGNMWVYVERSAKGESGPWVQVAYGQIHTANSPEGLRVWCGWQ